MTAALRDKPALVEALRARLEADVAAVERRQADAQAGATHAENRAEHAKDTRATEDGYLARGLAERVGELRRNVEALAAVPTRDFAADEAVAVGALVHVVTGFDGDADEPLEEYWLIAPGAAGLEVEIAGDRVLAVTPVSPLGRALLGCEVGHEGTVRTPRGERRFEILAIQ